MFTALSWFKTRSSKIIPFYICVAGAVYIFELVVYVVLDCYKYKPGILNDPFYDSAMGAIVSNGLIVPSTCTLIAVYGISFWWILLFAAGFMGVEQTFLYLGIFEHHWWKLIYTGIGLTLLFSAGKWLWKRLCQPEQPYLFRLIALYIINVSLQGTIMSFYLIFFHQIEYRPGWFENTSRDNIAFATLIVHIDSILFALLISLRGNWLWKTSLIGLLGISLLWLIQRGIVYATGIWPVLLLLVLQLAVIQLLSRINRILTARTAPHGQV